MRLVKELTIYCLAYILMVNYPAIIKARKSRA